MSSVAFLAQEALALYIEREGEAARQSMPVQIDEVKAEIQASSAYLRTLSGTEKCEQASQLRFRRLRSVISKADLDPDSGATVIGMVKQMPGPRECKNELINQVAEIVMSADSVPAQERHVSEDLKSSKNQKQQCYCSILNFMTKLQWESENFENEMILTACALGLKNPTEDTCATMVAASEAQEKGLDEARKLTYVHLYDHLQAVKDKINKQRANWPATGVRGLPATPDVLCHRHPDLYSEVLDGKALVPCPLQTYAFEAFEKSLPRRSSHAGYQAELRAMKCGGMPNTMPMQAFGDRRNMTKMQASGDMVNMMDMQASCGMNGMMQMMRMQQMLLQQMQTKIQELEKGGNDQYNEDIPGLTICSEGLPRNRQQPPALQDRCQAPPNQKGAQLALEDRQQNPAPRRPTGRWLEIEGHQASSAAPGNSSKTAPCERKSVKETTDILLASLKKKSKKKDEEESDDATEASESTEKKPKNKSKKKRSKKKSKKKLEKGNEPAESTPVKLTDPSVAEATGEKRKKKKKRKVKQPKTPDESSALKDGGKLVPIIPAKEKKTYRGFGIEEHIGLRTQPPPPHHTSTPHTMFLIAAITVRSPEGTFC